MATELATTDALAAALSQRIRAARIRANLTQDELARELGVTTRSIQNWEAGTFPQPKMRRRLVTFLAQHEEAVA